HIITTTLKERCHRSLQKNKSIYFHSPTDILFFFFFHHSLPLTLENSLFIAFSLADSHLAPSHPHQHTQPHTHTHTHTPTHTHTHTYIYTNADHACSILLFPFYPHTHVHKHTHTHTYIHVYTS